MAVSHAHPAHAALARNISRLSIAAIGYSHLNIIPIGELVSGIIALAIFSWSQLAQYTSLCLLWRYLEFKGKWQCQDGLPSLEQQT
jgi:hypothetical protein